MIHFECPGCRKTYQAEDRSAGRKMECSRCGQAYRIPTSRAAGDDSSQRTTVRCPDCGTAVTHSSGAAIGFLECPRCSRLVDAADTRSGSSLPVVAHLCGGLALLLGIVAPPLALGLSSPLVGVLLATLGGVLAIVAVATALGNTGSGLVVGTISLAICGSTVCAMMMLVGGPRGLRDQIEDRLAGRSRGGRDADAGAERKESAPAVSESRPDREKLPVKKETDSLQERKAPDKGTEQPTRPVEETEHGRRIGPLVPRWEDDAFARTLTPRRSPPAAPTLPEPGKSIREPERGKPPEERILEEGAVVGQLQKRDEEELRQQLLLAPEVSLDSVAGTSEGLVQTAERMQTAGLVYPGPALIAGSRPDLVGLPLRMGLDCQLGKEPAENLQGLSRRLRTHLAEATLARSGDPRPDPDRLREKLLGGTRPEWLTPEAIPALLQLLQAENRPVRQVLVDVLTRIDHPRSTQALAMRALVDLSPQVREAALRALKDRRVEDYRDLFLAGLSYPWIPVQEHAAEALVSLRDRGAVPELVRTLDLPPATMSFPVRQGKTRVLVTRELVRVNHLTNCVLCHAPSFTRADLVRGAIPRLDRELPPPNSTPYYEGPGRMIRADSTYLRQDFSVVQPVLRTAPRWPTQQRFDYMVRIRPVTPEEQGRLDRLRTSGALDRLREPVLFALRKLTGKDLGPEGRRWRELTTGSRTEAGQPGVRTVQEGRRSDWDQFLALRRSLVVEQEKDQDAAGVARELLRAPRHHQDRLLGVLRDGEGVEFTDAFAGVIPKLKEEPRKKARRMLAERLTRMKATTLRDKFTESDTEVRRAAALACGVRRFRELTPELITLLGDRDSTVQRAAHVALKEVSGKDLGPAGIATAEERDEAIRRWRKWWSEQQ